MVENFTTLNERIQTVWGPKTIDPIIHPDHGLTRGPNHDVLGEAEALPIPPSCLPDELPADLVWSDGPE